MTRDTRRARNSSGVRVHQHGYCGTIRPYRQLKTWKIRGRLLPRSHRKRYLTSGELTRRQIPFDTQEVGYGHGEWDLPPWEHTDLTIIAEIGVHANWALHILLVCTREWFTSFGRDWYPRQSTSPAVHCCPWMDALWKAHRIGTVNRQNLDPHLATLVTGLLGRLPM